MLTLWIEISCLWIKKVSWYILGLWFTWIGWINFINHTSWGTPHEGLRSIYENFNLTVHPNPPSQSITSYTCKEKYIIKKILIMNWNKLIFPIGNKAPWHAFWLILMSCFQVTRIIPASVRIKGWHKWIPTVVINCLSLLHL